MTTKQKHTPEPGFVVEHAHRQNWAWEVRWTNNLNGFAAAGRCYARCDSEGAARKIANALNACAGIPTEQLGSVADLLAMAKAADALLDCLVDEDWRDMNLPVPDRQGRKAALAPFQKDSGS